MTHIQEKEKSKKWILISDRMPISQAGLAKFASELGIHPVVAKLLYLRGYQTVSDMRAFLSMENESIPDPFLMKDMDIAVERIKKAIDSHEKILIYGDYDADGVTAVSTLYLFLRSKGAFVSYYIPNRLTDGYGVSKEAVDTFKHDDISLVITVDTGITAIDEIDYANTLGLDFVVTDHHECHSELPAACANVNPHRPDCPYPYKELAGVGVVFKVLCAFEEKYSGLDRLSATLSIFDSYADLVALGTIADVMPITGENRIIVSHGISLMEKNPRIGICALMDASAGKPVSKTTKITSTYLGFSLVSRINAAGRITSADEAVKLFLADRYDRAYEIAMTLCKANKERQDEENKIIGELQEQLDLYMDPDLYPIIVLSDDHWHHGVIGIVSSRITEKYCRPSILVSFEGNQIIPSDTDVGKGSGRSIKGLNLVDALCHCSDLLVKFGGHELAAGLSVTRENLPLFRDKINAYARENLSKESLIPTLEGDLEIPFSSISIHLANALHVMEPYGTSNPVPVFLTRGCYVQEITPVSLGKHTKFSLGDGRFSVTAMYFSHSPESLPFHVGDAVDVMYTLDVNEWYNRRSVQMILKDIRISTALDGKKELDEETFRRIWGGDGFSVSDDYLPSRDDFKAVYLMFMAANRNGLSFMKYEEMLFRLSVSDTSLGISYVKLRIILKVMMELNILSISEEKDGCTFAPRFPAVKTDLEKSSLLKKLRNQQK